MGEGDADNYHIINTKYRAEFYIGLKLLDPAIQHHTTLKGDICFG